MLYRKEPEFQKWTLNYGGFLSPSPPRSSWSALPPSSLPSCLLCSSLVSLATHAGLIMFPLPFPRPPPSAPPHLQNFEREIEVTQVVPSQPTIRKSSDRWPTSQEWRLRVTRHPWSSASHLGSRPLLAAPWCAPDTVLSVWEDRAVSHTRHLPSTPPTSVEYQRNEPRWRKRSRVLRDSPTGRWCRGGVAPSFTSCQPCGLREGTFDLSDPQFPFLVNLGEKCLFPGAVWGNKLTKALGAQDTRGLLWPLQ